MSAGKRYCIFPLTPGLEILPQRPCDIRWYTEVHDKVDYELDVSTPLTSTVRSIRRHNLILVSSTPATGVLPLSVTSELGRGEEAGLFISIRKKRREPEEGDVTLRLWWKGKLVKIKSGHPPCAATALCSRGTVRMSEKTDPKIQGTTKANTTDTRHTLTNP